MPLTPRTASARRCLIALGFIAGLLATAIGAALTASGSPMLPALETCCLLATGLVVILELCPAVVAMRAERAALRRLRRQLDGLPETPHPLDRVARPRSKR
jgi:hypothetical protein